MDNSSEKFVDPFYDFERYIGPGDEFILAYLWSGRIASFEYLFHLSTVNRFSIAHALELYFKACIVKFYSLEVHIWKKYFLSHNLYDLFKYLKEKDPNFLSGIEIKQCVYDSYTTQSDKFNKLSVGIQKEIVKVGHLLFLFKYCSDLKYNVFHSKHDLKGTTSYAMYTSDYRFAEIFYEIRQYVDFKGDTLSNALNDKIFNENDPYDRSKIEFIKICIYGKDYDKK